MAGPLALGANPVLFKAICGSHLKQFTYTLQPLDRDDTARYLAFRLTVAGMSENSQESVFSAEAIDRIHEASRGNISLINILATESLRNASEDKSTKKLLDHVKVSSEPTQVAPITSSRDLGHQGTARGQVAGLAALFILAAASVYYLPFGKRSKQGTVEPPAVTEDAPVTQAQKAPTPPTPPTFLPPSPDTTPPETTTVNSPQDGSAQQLQMPSPVTATVTTQPPVVQLSAPVPPKPVTILPTVRKVAPNQLTDKNTKKKFIPGGQFFDERERATRTWIAGGLRGRFTVQVMVLADSKEKNNIHSIFEGNDFQEARDQIYILRNPANPPTIYVFHGVYRSIQEARQARDNLPGNMKKYSPYPLPITDAIKKKETVHEAKRVRMRF